MGTHTRRAATADNSIHQDGASNRQDSRKRLKALEFDSEALLRKAPVGVLLCDARGKITFANALVKKMAQLSPIGRSLDAVPGIFGEMFDERGRHIAASEWPCAGALRGEVTSAKACHLVRWDRSSFYVLMSACPTYAAGSQITGAMTTLIDISEQTRREVALRGEAISKERSRMAAEIHDGLSQGLNAIVLQLDGLKHQLHGDLSQALLRVSVALELARQNLAEARRSMWVLSHPSFDNEDPASAISFLARQLFDGSSAHVELSLQGQAEHLFPQTQRELVQIAKEAMVNALKHANPTKVHVELVYDLQTVRLSVSDDGPGFIRAPISENRQGYGLFSMRTRAENLGGKFLVDSHLGRGTRISVIVPFSRLASRSIA
jgi:signal transduction histidine kinase